MIAGSMPPPRTEAATRPLRVLHVNTADHGGGAEAVALALHRACLARGHESRLVVGRRLLDVPDVLELDALAPRGLGRVQARARRWAAAARPSHPLLARLARAASDPRAAAEALLGVERFGFPAAWRLLDAMPPAPPDVVHVHNLHGDYFDLRALAPLSRRVPVVATLHDEWLMTGHCAGTLGCERWREGCGRCPHLATDPAVRRDATRFNWRRKQRALGGARLHVVTPSRWLLERVRTSLVAPAIVEARVIPNGVDLDVFRPGPQAEARQALGLDPRARVLLFAASNPRTNPFKDFAGLLTAAARLSGRHRPLLVMALGEDAPSERAGDAQVQFARVVDDPRRLALYQRAADVYVHAARAESATPRAVQEAMACGRPVVAAAAGAAAEQLEDGRTALIVAPGEPEALARAIAALLDDPTRAARLGAAAAAKAIRDLDARARIDDHLGWYRRLAGLD